MLIMLISKSGKTTLCGKSSMERAADKPDDFGRRRSSRSRERRRSRSRSRERRERRRSHDRSRRDHRDRSRDRSRGDRSRGDRSRGDRDRSHSRGDRDRSRGDRSRDRRDGSRDRDRRADDAYGIRRRSPPPRRAPPPPVDDERFRPRGDGPKRLRPNAKSFAGFLTSVVSSREREDRELRQAADARLAELEFGDRDFHNA